MTSESSLKRALLIGCPHKDLRGVANDVELMRQLLQSFGFTVIKSLVKEANRDGILKAFQELIDDVLLRDTVVVFYSGHGGLAPSTKMNLKGAPPYFQYLVPIDFAETTDEDFRGISDVEISHFLRDLSHKTENVTAIFDCCHSAGYRDGPGLLHLRIKSLTQDRHTAISSHIRRLRDAGKLAGNTFIEGNPNVVRVTAAATNGYAWECQNEDEQDMGIFTYSIHRTLTELGPQGVKHVSWGTLISRIRQLVLTLGPEQQPEVAGPVSRLLFALEEVDLSSLIDFRITDGQATLNRGALAAIQVGDVYDVFIVGQDRYMASNCVAQITITHVELLRSQAMVTKIGQKMSTADTALVALPSRKVSKVSLRIEGDEAFSNTFIMGIEESPYFTRNHLTDTYQASIKQNEPFIELLNDEKKIIRYTDTRGNGVDQRAVQETLFRLKVYYQAQKILSLPDVDPGGDIARFMILEFGVVTSAQLVERKAKSSADSPVVTEGERIYLKIINGGKESLWISAFDIGLSGSIQCLTDSKPSSGKELDRGRTCILGTPDFSANGKVRGIKLGWADSVPRDRDRQETIVVVASTQPLDLSYWKTGKERMTPVGVTRTDNTEDIRYCIKRIGFKLRPRC